MSFDVQAPGAPAWTAPRTPAPDAPEGNASFDAALNGETPAKEERAPDKDDPAAKRQIAATRHALERFRAHLNQKPFHQATQAGSPAQPDAEAGKAAETTEAAETQGVDPAPVIEDESDPLATVGALIGFVPPEPRKPAHAAHPAASTAPQPSGTAQKQDADGAGPTKAALQPTHGADAAPSEATPPVEAQAGAALDADAGAKIASDALPAIDAGEPARPILRAVVTAEPPTPPLPLTTARLASALTAEAAGLVAPKAAPAVAMPQHSAPIPMNTLQIQLHPAELGMVTASLRFSGAQLSIEIQVANADAYVRLKDDGDAIMGAMRSMGYEVDKVTILQPQGAVIAPARTDQAQTSTAQSGQQGWPGAQPDDTAGGRQRGRDPGERHDQTSTAPAGPPAAARPAGGGAVYI